MNPRRLLQRADRMAKQLDLKAVATLLRALGVFDVKIPDDALRSFVHEKAVTVDASTLDRSKTRQDPRVRVAHNHVSRGPVVPMKSLSPHRNLLLYEDAQVGGRKVTKVENLHGKLGPAAGIPPGLV